MIRKYRSLFSQPVLIDIAKLFSLDVKGLTELDGYESLVFDAGDYILKIIDGDSRSKDELDAELRFIYYLAQKDAPVASVLTSTKGNLVEVIALRDNGKFLISAYEKVAGEAPSASNASGEFFALMGQTMGQLHKLSKRYEPTAPLRNHWHRDEHVAKLHETLPKTDDALVTKITELYEHLRSLPTDKGSYGLIHADFHSDNLLWDGERLTVIDFADCLYGWFVMDIATALFYFRRFLPRGHNETFSVQAAFAERFYKSFIKGYQQEIVLEPWAKAEIPNFVRWRYCDLYLYLSLLKQSTDLEANELEALEEYREIIVEDKVPDFGVSEEGKPL